MENIKEYAARKKAELKKYLEDNDLHLKTVVIRVGENPASAAYVKGKVKDCEEVGIECEVRHFPESISESDLLIEVAKCNTDPSIDGFIVQLPLPKHISEAKITEAIDYKKDIDGFTKQSLVNPATPQGILTYLEDNNFNFVDANAVVIGRSNIVGKPLANLMINAGATVTVCNSKTDINTLRVNIAISDIFISAIGVANYFNKEMFEFYRLDNTIAIDVGINRDEEGKLCGDIDRELYDEFKAVTSVPGGVGIMTVLEVIRNSIECYKRHMDGI